MTRFIASAESLTTTPPARTLGGLLGLVDGEERAFPLRVVKVRSRVTGSCCRTEIRQRFANPYDKVLEATYVFPLPEDGAVVEMEVTAGATVIRGVCLERKEAETKFAEARDSGQRAAIVTEERGDIYTLQVTNIPALTDVWVRLVVIERLVPEEGRLVWRFPTTIAPRYIPGDAIGHRGHGVEPDTDAVPDASRISPPLSLSGGARLDLEVEISGTPASLVTSFACARVDEPGRTRIAPTFSPRTDRDFVVELSYARGIAPAVSAFTDGTHTLVLVEPPLDAPGTPLPRDAVFVLDRSGSMLGPKFEAAKRALGAAMRELSAGDTVTIFSFANDVTTFGPMEVNPSTLALAGEWIDSNHANGGTEMLAPLTQAIHGRVAPGRVRTVVLVTDAESGDEHRLSAVVAGRDPKCMLFVIGVDTAVNTQLVRKLARLGGGASLCTSPDDGSLDTRITAFMKSVGSPLLEDVRTEGGAPANPEPRVVYRARGASIALEGCPGEVTMIARGASGEVRHTTKPERIEMSLGALWARERVQWLEDRLSIRTPLGDAKIASWLDDDEAHTPESGGDESRRIEEEIRTVALTHGIASRFTAFVAIDEASKVTGERVEVVQPSAMPALAQSATNVKARYRSTASFEQARSMTVEQSEPYEIIRNHSEETFGKARSMIVESFSSSSNRSAPPAPRTGYAPTEIVRRTIGTLKDSVKKRFGGALSRRQKEAELARLQGEDGSFGGIVDRTAAALLLMILLGSDTTKGTLREEARRAKAWLESQNDGTGIVEKTLALLNRVEAGGPVPFAGELDYLGADGPEAMLLLTHLRDLEHGEANETE